MKVLYKRVILCISAFCGKACVWLHFVHGEAARRKGMTVVEAGWFAVMWAWTW